MWADCQLRPLQGTKFPVMRRKMMNCQVEYNNDIYLITHSFCLSKVETGTGIVGMVNKITKSLL